jgi:hypothetical protein
MKKKKIISVKPSNQNLIFRPLVVPSQVDSVSPVKPEDILLFRLELTEFLRTQKNMTPINRIIKIRSLKQQAKQLGLKFDQEKEKTQLIADQFTLKTHYETMGYSVNVDSSGIIAKKEIAIPGVINYLFGYKKTDTVAITTENNDILPAASYEVSILALQKG